MEATSPYPQQAHADPPDAVTTFDDAELARSLAEAQRRRRPWRPDGRLRATMGQLPDEESASQWSGRKKAHPASLADDEQAAEDLYDDD